MILPIGHDRARLRRRPWVTLALAGGCLVAFLATSGLGDPVHDRFQAQLEEAYAFWADHPYLEPPERLVHAYGDPGASAREEFHAAWEAQGFPPVPRVQLDHEQTRLERQVEEAEATLRTHVWYRLGLVPAAPRAVGALGHLFLHGSWGHLLGNLLFLLLCGPFVEDRWGRVAFLLFYLGAGLAGGLLFATRHPDFDGPLIGASGAIAGAMGAFAVRFGRARIRFVYWLGLFFGSFRAPAWLMLALWALGELLHALTGGGAGGTAYWAHVGGFGFGLVVAGTLRASGLEARLGPTPDEACARRADAEAAARRALADGRPEDALALLEPALESGGDAPPTPASLGMARAAAEAAGRLPELREALGRPLRRAIHRGRAAEARARIAALRAADVAPALEPREARRLAGWLADAGDPGGAAEALRAALEAAPDASTRLAVAAAARGVAPVVAWRAAERVLAGAGADAEARRRAARLLADAREAVRARGIVVLPAAEGAGAHAPDAAPPVEPGRAAASATPHAGEPAAHATECDAVAALPPDAADEAVADALAGALGVPGEPAPTAAPAATPQPTAAQPAPACTAPSVREEAKPEPALPPAAALRVVEARPLGLDARGLRLALEGRGTVRLAFARIDAVAVGGVRGLGRSGRAVLLVDLVVEAADAAGTRRVVRLRSDRFDPRALLDDPEATPRAALERLVALLAARARAPRLPADAGRLRIFASCADWEREVLGAPAPASAPGKATA